MRPKSSSLTDHELEFMQIIWDRGEVTVRDVYEALLERRKIAYTTVMTNMKTLQEKGYLKTSQRDRAYVYRPIRPKSQVVTKMVRDLIDRLFDGSARPLVAHLLEERQLSESDLTEISRLIAQKKQKTFESKN